MSRIGFAPTRESAEEVSRIAALPGIEIEGMFTHFARADEADKTSANGQLLKFREFTDMVKALGVEIPVCHCSNSAGIMELCEANMDAVRAGITIYGLYPSDEVVQENMPLKPAMELKSFLTYIKEIGPGTPVSYGGTFVAEKPMRIATVSAGYGDGYPRNLSGKGYILVCGKKAPILGRVCMDQFMVDVTDIPEAEEGMEVTLLGRDGGLRITMEELAALSGGFHYEIPCVIGKRVPRVYSRHGRDVAVMAYPESVYREI
jgi:alanine racemase